MPRRAQPDGLLLSFEGAEGSGKSTQIELLAAYLRQQGREVVVTREPGGTAVGEEIRKLLIHTDDRTAIFPETELLLFAASRAQLVREVLIPSLEAGKVVLCDRYLDSTTVYQGAARSLSPDPVSQINTFAVGGILPAMTFILDVPPEVSLSRIKKRGGRPPDRIERETAAFYRKVREGYLLLARSLPSRFHVLDGTRPEETIADEISQAVRRLF
ncbi:MAG: dTMP kinase [Puniceicoccaceae bacterium]|nr:MAG: dTMP kinase [Puniceicoccaceae bacterium]